jgi:hypothetical protein
MIIYHGVIYWILRNSLIHPLKNGVIALKRHIVNPFQGYGCCGCQNLLRWSNLILPLSGQHSSGDGLHLVDELLEVRIGKSARDSE